jgi:sulfotransferase
MKNFIFVSGLPRSGSTLMCQLLGVHPHVYSDGHSSPLSSYLEKIRSHANSEPFLKSQMDIDAELLHSKIKNATLSFFNGWFFDAKEDCVVDKSRQWLVQIETLKQLIPDFKMIVCIRNLVDIFGSIEKSHQKTIMFPFPDGMAPNSASARTESLFSPSGVIGSPLIAIQNMLEINQRIPEIMKDNVYFVAFEALLDSPQETMNNVFEFIGLKKYKINFDNLPVNKHESDSYYNMKYSHKTYPNLIKLDHDNSKFVSQKNKDIIMQKNYWYYNNYYPHLIENKNQ